MQKKESSFFLKKIFSISFVSLISRIFGLLREIVITFLLGASIYSDAFYLAYAIPNLFRRFTAEGAMLTTFIPVFTKLHQEQGAAKAKKFAKNIFWSLFLLLSIFCILFILFSPWIIANIFARGFQGLALEQSIFLNRLLFSYILLISLSAIYQSILNFHNIFFPSAFSPILLNIAIIFCGLVFGKSVEKATLGLSVGVILGGLAQFIYSHFAVVKLKYSIWGQITIFDKEVRQTFKKMLGGLFSAGIYQINIIIGYIIASQLYAGSITSLTLSNRLIEFTLGILIVSITTILLPQLTKFIVSGKIDLAKAKLRESLLLGSFISFPATVGLILTGESIIRILFLRGEFDENSVHLTSQALMFHSVGLFFIAWNRIFTANLHSSQHFKKPAYLAFFAMLVNAVLCWQGVEFFGHAAIALANSLSQVFLLLLHLFTIPKKMKPLWNSQFFSQFIRQILANVILLIMICFWIDKLSQNLYLQFLSLFFIALLTYFCACYLLKVRELKNILLLFKNKK